MKKNLFISLVSFMIISILGIIVLQGYWIFSAWNDKEEEFSLAVQQSLMMVAEEIQERELSDYITAYEKVGRFVRNSRQCQLCQCLFVLG
jgi:two-component system phosphate regulon sensor histidine kinase PhoR